MPSPSYTEWQREGLPRLDELEQLHVDARGAGPGRRWGTEQLNRSLLVALVASSRPTAAASTTMASTCMFPTTTPIKAICYGP